MDSGLYHFCENIGFLIVGYLLSEAGNIRIILDGHRRYRVCSRKVDDGERKQADDSGPSQ